MPFLVQVYTCLSERVGLRDHEQVLNVMLGKIGTNLKSFGACEEVVTLTLSLFQVFAPFCMQMLCLPVFLSHPAFCQAVPCRLLETLQLQQEAQSLLPHQVSLEHLLKL